MSERIVARMADDRCASCTERSRYCIFGFGGISINAAVQDTRIKATVSSTMGAFDPYGFMIADLPFLTFSLLDHADEIRSAVLVVHGEKAYSLPASREAFGKLKGDNKELMIIPGASHTDLYDRTDIIP